MTGVGGVGRQCVADSRTDIVRVRVYVEPPCDGDSFSGDLRLFDGGDSAVGSPELCYEDRDMDMNDGDG